MVKNYFVQIFILFLLGSGLHVVAMEEKDTFLEYMVEQKKQISLLKMAKSAGSFVPFLGCFVENRLSKEIKNRGYNDFSQKIVRVGIDYLSENTDQQFYPFLDEPTEDCIEYIQEGREFIQNQLQSFGFQASSKEGKNVIVLSLYKHFIDSCCTNEDVRKILKQGMNKELVYQEIHNAELYLFLNMYLEFIATKADTIQNQ